jgi:hypothetical protein
LDEYELVDLLLRISGHLVAGKLALAAAEGRVRPDGDEPSDTRDRARH